MGVTWGLVGVPSFGPSKYWCYQESFSSNKSAGLIVIGINVILFCTTALCFFAVLMRMQKYKTKFSQKKVVTIRDSKAMDSGFAPKDTIATKTKANANDLQSTISQGFKGMAANQPTLKDQYNTVENRAVRKMLLHIVSFFIQWSSTIPYCLGTVFDYYEDWIYVMCNVGMNLGGIMNLTAYLINQRK
jgi:hypothetical protein